MPFFNWDDSYSVHNPAIDAQHRQLVDLVNELHDAMKAGKGQDTLGHVFNSLLEYTEMHFRSEEALFNISDYPNKAGHIREHQKLMKEAVELKKKFDSGTQFLTMETLNFVRDWVMHHIKETDMGYKDFI